MVICSRVPFRNHLFVGFLELLPIFHVFSELIGDFPNASIADGLYLQLRVILSLALTKWGYRDNSQFVDFVYTF
jgi:hypothetical protein